MMLQDGGGSAAPKLATLARSPLRRSRRTKLLWTLAGTLFFILFLTRSDLRLSPVIPDFYNEHPSQPLTSLKDEVSPAIKPAEPQLSKEGKFPSGVVKPNPSFHLIIRGPQKNPSICRTIFTAMALNYPPPTVVYLGDPIEEEGGPKYGKLDTLLVLSSYLTKNKAMKDDDIVLIIDDNDTWFQLPPEVLLQRFHALLVNNNQQLGWRYGNVPDKVNKSDPNVKSMQKYSQRIIFAADKICRPDRPFDAFCYAVPASTLPPDIYGPKTDSGKKPGQNRPRWLNSGAIMGMVADVKRMYERAAEINSKLPEPMPEQRVLAKIYGEQEYVRELDRRLTAPNWYHHIGELLGLIPRIDIARIYVKMIPGRRYDFGIGLDYKSELFFSTSQAASDLEWIRYNNVTHASSAQRDHHVPREARLNLPPDVASSQNPFLPPHPQTAEMMPPYNATVDYLPPPQNVSWHNIPLATNLFSATIPTLLHTNTNTTDLDSLATWWKAMWYRPWSRALLRKYMRSARGPIAAEAALRGGAEAWDTRGGKGGLWTDNDEWVDWTSVCKGIEEDIFGNDGFGKWGEENGFDYQAPVYNQFGMLVTGREPRAPPS
ncbi:hypothetical protein FQN53_002007 [Emmonsiellopsis sp. PD_33]|nr:hypothetical protein FQN53_002007 [Emmonsiellopsis sp. PD_33]